MMPSPGPIQPQHAGASSSVVQGFFPGGRPRIIQSAPAPAVPVRPPSPTPIRAHPANGALQPATRPGQPPRPILPTNSLQPRAAQAAAPVRPPVPQPILPKSATPSTVQPHAGDAFALPATFALKPRGSGQPLPEPVQKKMEAFFNTSFADVRVHVGNEAPSIGALAFTHGTDLYFAPGQYNPQSSQGQQLLGHELTHVVQQRAGRVRNPLGAGVAVVQDPALEAEAERMGLRAVSTALPIQAKPLGPGPVITSSQSPGIRPSALTAKGAILTARSPADVTVQSKPGPITPGNPAVIGKSVTHNFPSPRKGQLATVAPIRAQMGSSIQRAEEKPWPDDELLEWIDAPEEGLLESLGEKNYGRLKVLKEGLAHTAAVMDSVNNETNMPSFEHKGTTYHINLTTATSHITKEGSPKIHYFFKGTGNAITDEQPVKKERGGSSKKKVKGVKGKVKTKTVFSLLPLDVQKFVKENWDAILG